MRRRTYKRGPSLEYEKKRLERLDNIEKSKVPLEIPLFRGFLPADGFITSNGFRGMKLDSLWSKYLLDSFITDDIELGQIALESCLADVHATVQGGQYGSAMSIGDCGFFTEQQFQQQGQILCNYERKYCKGMFLSEDEWKVIDKKLYKLSEYGNSKLLLAVNGDNWINLAVRENAYKMAKLFLDKEVDPLIVNENNDDLIDIVKQQYKAMALRLSNIQLEKEESTNKVLLPTEEKDLNDRENNTCDAIKHMLTFIGTLKDNLIHRLKIIEKDKWTKRQATLRGHIIPSEIIWSCNQEDKVNGYIKEMTEIQQYISERLQRFTEVSKLHIPLSTLMHIQQKFINGRKKKLLETLTKSSPKNNIIPYGSNDSDVDEMEQSIDSPFLLGNNFNVLKLEDKKDEDDEFKLTKEEENILNKNKHKLLNIHKSKDAMTKDELSKVTGISINDDDDDYTFQQIGEGINATYHRVKIPKRNKNKINYEPTIGILSQNDYEVIHYR